MSPCENISAHIIRTTTDIQILPKPSQKQSMDFNACTKDFFTMESTIPTIKNEIIIDIERLDVIRI
jgi:hypothetical protein